MPSLTVGSLDIARRRTMARFEGGEIPVAEAELTRLIELMGSASDLRSRQLVYNLYQDRATVRRRANRWDDALADLSAAEGLIEDLPLPFHASFRSTIAHARALILSEPRNPRANPAEAQAQIGRIRQAGPGELAAAADDLESRLAYRAGDWTRATILARRAAKALDGMGWRGAAAICRRRAAEALLGAGDITGAERELMAAHRHIDQYGTPVDIAFTELVHGRLLSAQGDHDGAWKRTEHALEKFDGLIRRFSVLSEQQSFLVDKLDHYGEAFAIALNAGGDQGCLRAWSVAERSKSFYLCQLLASAEVPLFEGLDPTELSALRKTGEQLDQVEKAYGNLGTGAQEGPAGRELIAQLHEISRRKTETLQRLMRSNPRWALVTVPRGLDMAEQIERLPDGWSLLSYYWDTQRDGREASRLHLFWTDGSRQPRHTVAKWTPRELKKLREIRGSLQGKVPMGATLIPELLTDGILPPEVCHSIPEGFRLLISPHGPLQLLPLHALILGSGDYAAGMWAIQYIPTLALLPLTQASVPKDPVLLIGCEQDGFGSRALDDVPDELGALGDVWSAQPARPVTARLIPREGSPEREGVGIEKWAEFGIVHVACHGDFPANRPFDAGLRLGSASIRTSDFFGIRLDGAVASFSACSVARHAEDLDGRAVVGDEWIGLCLPLLYAGASCVVASLWEAYSAQAAQFMNFLHVALKRGDDPADAARWAQDRTASEMRLRLPATWANWYPVGLPIAARERH